MLVYDTFYYDAKSGRRKNDFDSRGPGVKKAWKGEVAHNICKNGASSESYWVDETGAAVPPAHPARTSR
jgi:hypothetical protein